MTIVQCPHGCGELVNAEIDAAHDEIASLRERLSASGRDALEYKRERDEARAEHHDAIEHHAATLAERTAEHAIEIAECVHCGGYTLNPVTDICYCGCELYPITKVVPPGTHIELVLDDSRLAIKLPKKPV